MSLGIFVVSYTSTQQGIKAYVHAAMKTVKQYSWLTSGLISHSKIPRNVVHVAVDSRRMTFPKAPTNISLTVKPRGGLGWDFKVNECLSLGVVITRDKVPLPDIKVCLSY